jgi:hypothetical protein
LGRSSILIYCMPTPLSSYDYQINPDNGFTNLCEEEPLAESHQSKDSELHPRRQKHPPSHKPLLPVPRYSRRANCPWNPHHLSQVPNTAYRGNRAVSQICPSCFRFLLARSLTGPTGHLKTTSLSVTHGGFRIAISGRTGSQNA